MSNETLLNVAPAAAAGDTFIGLFGVAVPRTLDVNAHTWVANSSGLYGTTANLQQEWHDNYMAMLNGRGATLTAVQRLEGNAEAVFENTGLSKLSAATQSRDRQDVQREFDAIATALASTPGLDASKPLSENGYIQMERTLQGNFALEELGIQGHGLNKPPEARYRGYTNDFQNNVDNKTLYVGPGLNHNERAIPDFFDDNVLTHAPFPTVFHNGRLEQLNQNGNAENTLAQAVSAFDQSAYTQVLTSADFSRTAAHGSHAPTASPVAPIQTIISSGTVTPGGTFTTLFGDTISGTISVNGHTWTTDSTGLFQTATDLAAEWGGYYADMLAGRGSSLTAIQRLEGNAEALFENTGLSRLDASTQARDRADVQRELDAIAGAVAINAKTLGTDPTKPFTTVTYLQMERTLQGSPALEELAIQGHGLNHRPASRYRGYTNDFQNNVDNKTLYVGGGLNSGERAIGDFFDDNIISHAAFPVVFHNGHLEQLNQNGNAENTLNQAVSALNMEMFSDVLTAADFRKR